jgi:hypothetical protein
LFGKPEERRPLRRHGLRREDIIKVEFKNMVEVMDWIDLAQGRDQ